MKGVSNHEKNLSYSGHFIAISVFPGVSLAVLERGYAALQEDVAAGNLENVHGTVEDMASALRLISSAQKNDETILATAQ